MIESLPDELNQFESEYAKGAKLHANIILELERDKCYKTYVNVLEINYILMIRKQNILAILIIFLKLL